MGRRELFLKHAFDGIDLDPEYREKTMEHIYHLWDRPIYLETVVQNKKVIFHFNGTKHSISEGEGRN
jgi:stage V sporulation protein R